MPLAEKHFSEAQKGRCTKGTTPKTARTVSVPIVNFTGAQYYAMLCKFPNVGYDAIKVTWVA